MNQQKVAQALTTGLLAGYGGQTKCRKTLRGSFELSSSHFEEGDIVYHDEWTNNGGQEIVKIGEVYFTRVYAGGMASPDIFSKLDITPGDVIVNLVSRIKQLKDKTRLFVECQTETQSDWGYEYKIIDQDNQLLTTTGKETITYQDQIVFVHVFVLSPITK